MVLLALFCATPLLQTLAGLKQQVTVMLPAAPAPKIITELGNLVGVTLRSTGVFAKDVLLIDVHETPLSEVMARIADVAGGTWKSEQGAFRLTRTAEAENMQEDRERRYRMQVLEAEIATSKEIRDRSLTTEKAKQLSSEFQKAREKNPRYSFSPYGPLGGSLNQTPSKRALLRLIANLDLTEIAMLDPGDRIVFSNKPTHMERALPVGSDDVLTKFVQEQNIWSDAVAGAGEGGQTKFAGDPLDARDPVTAAPDRALLSASRSNSMAPVQFHLYLMANGLTVADADIALGSESIRKMSQRMLNQAQEAGTKVTLRPDSLALLEATKGWQRPNDGPAPGPTAKTVDLLVNPERLDPLGFVATDGFVSVAEAKHENLIASLPDELVALNFMPNASTLTLAGFIETATAYGDLQIEEKGSWMTVKPQKEYSARHIRVDRDALGKYLRAIAAEGRASLAAQSEFALNAQPTDYDTFGMPMGMLLDLNSTQNVDNDWVALKLWGALSNEQRNALIKGSKIPFRQLTPTQLGLVAREAYNKTIKSVHGLTNLSLTDFRRKMEGSECLPDGLPPDGTLAVEVEDSPAILASSTTKNVRMGFARVFDANQLGSSLAYFEKQPDNANANFNRFQVVSRVNYKIDLEYTKSVSDSRTLHDIVVPADSVPLALNDLPSALRQKILDAKEAAKGNQGAGQVRQVPPPF